MSSIAMSRRPHTEKGRTVLGAACWQSSLMLVCSRPVMSTMCLPGYDAPLHIAVGCRDSGIMRLELLSCCGSGRPIDVNGLTQCRRFSPQAVDIGACKQPDWVAGHDVAIVTAGGSL